MHILHIDSSVATQTSISRLLTAEVVSTLGSRHSDIEVRYRDLAAKPLGHYTAILRRHGDAAQSWSSDQQLELQAGEQVLSEFTWADAVVIGAPMYNFTIPTQLKVWIDHICVAGKTFRYTPTGAVGLCSGKRIIVVSTRGGRFATGSPIEHMDFQEKYLSTVFSFLGLTDIEFIRAEGVAYGLEARDSAVREAQRAITALNPSAA